MEKRVDSVVGSASRGSVDSSNMSYILTSRLLLLIYLKLEIVLRVVVIWGGFVEEVNFSRSFESSTSG